MVSQSRTILIVGGGFSGSVLAANLLRGAGRRPTVIALVERSPEIGRGVAYARRGYPFLLNVTAERMSATSRDPFEFVRFAQARQHVPLNDAFLRRDLYGDYLQNVLAEAEAGAPRHVRLERYHALVEDVRAGGDILQVSLADGRVLAAADVVLACGNPPPAQPAGTRDVLDHPRYVRDPYASEAQPPLAGRVLMIGTGLTMADTAIAAAEDSGVVLTALSRHGILPERQALAHSGTAAAALASGGEESSLFAHRGSLRMVVAAARTFARSHQRAGGDWRDAVNRIRGMAPALWRELPDCERQRFLRHVRTYWDTFRHRLPPAAAARIDELRRDGRLAIHAGRIRSMQPAGDAIRVTWAERGTTAHHEMMFDWVVNCTGPDYDLRRVESPLLRRLLAAGAVTPDTCGLGLRTGAHGAVIDRRGTVSDHLYYLGPMLRADHWECTAVGELREHAEALAEHLAADEAAQCLRLTATTVS